MSNSINKDMSPKLREVDKHWRSHRFASPKRRALQQIILERDYIVPETIYLSATSEMMKFGTRDEIEYVCEIYKYLDLRL